MRSNDDPLTSSGRGVFLRLLRNDLPFLSLQNNNEGRTEGNCGGPTPNQSNNDTPPFSGLRSDPEEKMLGSPFCHPTE